MIYSPAIKEAMLISEKVHHGQLDKGGYPYIFHPYSVAEILSRSMAFRNADQSLREDLICTALLHDVLEDGGVQCYYDYHMADKFSIRVKDALWLLTKDPVDSYQDYIDRITASAGTESFTPANYIAALVKQADLAHNLDCTRVENETLSDGLQNRYQRAYFQITGALGHYTKTNLIY